MKKVLILLLGLIGLLEVNFFYLISDLNNPLLRFNAENNKFLIAVLSILFAVFYFTFDNKSKYSLFFKNEIIIICTILFISFFYSAFRYDLNVVGLCRLNNYYMIYLLYFTAVPFVIRYDYYDEFESIIILFSTIYATLIVIQVFLWKNNGLSFLTVTSLINDDFEIDYNLSIRNGYTRITSPAAFIFFCTTISFAKLFQIESRHKALPFLFYLFCFLSGSIYLYTTGTRGLFFSYLFTVSLIVFLNRRTPSFFKIAFILLFFSYIFFNLSENAAFEWIKIQKDSNSYEYRYGAYYYFFVQSLLNPLLGLGLLNDSASQYATLLHGPSLVYYISDVGIVGFAGQMGLIAAFSYLSIIIRVCYVCILCRQKTGQWDLVLVGCSTFVVSTSFSLSLQLNSTIVGMILCLIVVECRRYRILQVQPVTDSDSVQTSMPQLSA